MNAIRTRSTLLATAIAATLALGACGDGRNDTAATSRDGAVATNRADAPKAPGASSSPYNNDRVTADASSANARSNTGSTAARSDATGASSATGPDAAARADKAGDRAASAAGDAAMTAKVKAALMAEPGIDSLQIDVDTSNGRVTLTGEVDNPQNRQRALQVARGVDGVSGVVDRMSVRR